MSNTSTSSKQYENEDDEQQKTIEISANEIKSDLNLSIRDSHSTESMSMSILPDKGIADYQVGETLAECSDAEWEQSGTAYSAQLLNVKKESDRVTVFAAPEKESDNTYSITQRKQQDRLKKLVTDKAKLENIETKVDNQFQPLTYLITKVMQVLLEGRESAVGVEFRR
uniref:Uncharacterized protein n=1 Tax=Heterorhabditis bacteriophora TaxID=37862 RepID=A0A1I7WC58_HETBA